MFFKKYKCLRQFKRYFGKHKVLIAVIFAVMVTASSMGMILAWFAAEQLIGITGQLTGHVVKFTILIIAAVTIHHICWYLWVFLSSLLFNPIARELRQDIMRKILNAKQDELKNNTSGYYIERMNEGVTHVSEFFHMVLGTLVDAATNLGFLIVICVLNWQCGLFFASVIVILLVIEFFKVKKDTQYEAKSMVFREGITSKLNETIAGMKDIKGLGIKQQLAEQNDFFQRENAKHNIKRTKNIELISKLSSFLTWFFTAVMILMCMLWLFPTGQITVVVLFMILDYQINAFNTVGFFSKIKSYYMQGDLGAKRILEITEGLQSETWGENCCKVSTASIHVKDLSFSYAGARKVLDGVSFMVAEKTNSVFVGNSGSGKTTLFGLLSKLLETGSGKIFIGGYDINEFTENSFRNAVCIINQEPFIFSDTVENNVKVVKPEAARDEVIEACKKANIHDEVLGFANGYDTVICENGANLSGGQKQRIAIARAILKDTPIVLFDEPTSALDRKNHALFFETLKELKKTKTILVIAHKLVSYDAFDNVFTLENGQLKH